MCPVGKGEDTMTRVDFFQHLVVKEITVNVHVYSSDDFVPQNGMDQ